MWQGCKCSVWEASNHSNPGPHRYFCLCDNSSWLLFPTVSFCSDCARFGSDSCENVLSLWGTLLSPNITFHQTSRWWDDFVAHSSHFFMPFVCIHRVLMGTSTGHEAPRCDYVWWSSGTKGWWVGKTARTVLRNGNIVLLSQDAVSC